MTLSSVPDCVYVIIKKIFTMPFKKYCIVIGNRYSTGSVYSGKMDTDLDFYKKLVPEHLWNLKPTININILECRSGGDLSEVITYAKFLAPGTSMWETEPGRPWNYIPLSRTVVEV